VSELTDRFRFDSGPYVLGALDSTERNEFEKHLMTCGECARAVQEFAVLPGLLARVPLREILDEGDLSRARAEACPAARPGAPADTHRDLVWMAGTIAVAACTAAVVRVLSRRRFEQRVRQSTYLLAS
jgi:anti-sigma factor RsiW